MAEEMEPAPSASPVGELDTATGGGEEPQGSEQQPDPDWNAPPAIAAVAALYSSERNDLGGLLAQSLALTSIGVAFMGVAAGFLSKADPDTAGVLLRLFLALPAWTVGAYLVIIMANVFTHNASVRVLETRLVHATGWHADTGEELGARSGEEITNIMTQPWPLKVQTCFAYGGIYLLIGGFTYYCIDSAVTVGKHGWTTEIRVAAALYGLAALTCIATWFYVFRLNESNQERANHLSSCRGGPDCVVCQKARRKRASRRS